MLCSNISTTLLELLAKPNSKLRDSGGGANPEIRQKLVKLKCCPPLYVLHHWCSPHAATSFSILKGFEGNPPRPNYHRVESDTASLEHAAAGRSFLLANRDHDWLLHSDHLVRHSNRMDNGDGGDGDLKKPPAAVAAAAEASDATTTPPSEGLSTISE